MTRLVALLRGVNVGGRKLSMGELRTGLERAGCHDVATYIQSGNVVLTPPSGARRRPRPWLEAAISTIAGYDVSVVVRTAAELHVTVARNPFPGVEATKLHVLFFDRDPTFVDELDDEPMTPESLVRDGRDVYLSLPNGMGKALLPVAIERAARRAGADVVFTARNWTTVGKLAELVGA